MTRRQVRKTVQRRGFTLMEVLLVLAILGIIAAMVVPSLMGRQRQAMIDRAKLDIKNIEKALDLYTTEHDGNFPTELKELFDPQPLPDGRKPRYIDKLVDPWGNPYHYSSPENSTQYFPNGDHPAIFSFGPDKQQGSQDDINNWDEYNKAAQASRQ